MSNKVVKRLRAFVKSMGIDPREHKGLMRRMKREYQRKQSRSNTL